VPSAKLTGWRKVASAMWREPDDPQIYGAIELDAGPLRAFLDAARAQGHRVTPTHLVGRAVAHALAQVPDLNVRIAFGRAIPRATVDVFIITAVESGRDLSGVKITGADQKSVFDIARELAARARTLKDRKDPTFAKSKQIFDRLPIAVLKASLRLASWLTGELDLDLKSLGMERSSFGSAMITSVGMFGLPMGFAPLAWMYKVPLLVLIGEIADKPVAIEGRVEVRPMLPITATIDHRYVDGFHISQLLRHFRAYLADPGAFEPAPPPAPAAPIA
jgi:pyruvate/2-oxoglutarate dehydrogenase complex dihydrolipoamide acyltransferase (E2) component